MNKRDKLGSNCKIGVRACASGGCNIVDTFAKVGSLMFFMSLQYKNFIEKHALKNTAQRRMMFDVVMYSNDHLTIDDVLKIVRKKYPRIGYTTVYRMLKLMVDAGILIEHHFDDKARYELTYGRGHHEHLICTSCGNITEFSCKRIEQFQDEVAADYGFKILSHKHELYGLCKQCQR